MTLIITLNLDFRLAKQDYADDLLRAIAEEALGFLFKNVDINRIKYILLTGSLANGEGTVIKHESSIVTSDFDFVVNLDLQYYLKNRNLFQKLSQEISERLVKKQIDTHVVFLSSAPLICFKNLSIYEYEFAISSKCIFGNAPSFSMTTRPTKRDALELTFTVVSDLVFSDFKRHSKIEESYIYAKRALTLLNSLLIFHGLFAETYEKRIKIAKRYVSQEILPLTQHEMEMLDIFTAYKLTGSFRQLFNSLSCKDINDLLRLQREFLTNLTLKILNFELNNLIAEKNQTNPRYNRSSQNAKFNELLAEYSKCSTAQLPSRILGIILYTIWSFTGNKKREELFANFIFRKQPPKIILNVIVALLLSYNSKASAKKFLDDLFPWITPDADSQPIEQLFSIWQAAEQSIKI